MNKLRKIFTASVMVMTLAVMLGFGSFAHAATPQAGDLIKMDGLSTVYFLGKDSKRYVYPHESVFFSWHRDFSGVVTVSASELQSYPLGANITMRPGTKLVKITTDPSVYAVEPNGVLRKIQSESDAIAVYGPNWAKRVVDVADSFFTNYTIGQPLASGEIAAGSLVKKSDDATVYYFDGTNYRAVASESAFYANRFSFNDVIAVTKEISPKANAISNNEFAYDPQNATGPVTTASGVTVSLSSATPAAASLVASQALAPLVSVNLTAANDGAVTLKSIKFKKAGIASDSSFSSLYLYDGNTRLTDGSSMSNGYVNFSGASLVTIPAGQTKTLTVKADIDAAAYTGNIGLSLAAATDVVSTGATVNGSFPINGNLMSLFARPGDMSTVTLSTTAAATDTVKAGSINTIVWTANATITSKPVDFKYLALQQVGSIQKDDLANFAIYVDGIKAGDGTFVDNKLVFDLSKAYRMNTGNHVIDVKADIVKGSSRTFSLKMQTTANAVFTDTNYNVNVAPSTAINGTSFTISSGSVTVSADSTFNATEIVKTASNATLARFTMKAWGEDVKINSLSADIKLEGKTGTTTEGMNDVAIYVDGNQVGSSQSSATSTAGDYTKSFAFGSNNLFTIEAGKQVTVEIHGSLSLDSNTSIKKVVTTLTAGTNNAEGVTSFDQISTSAAAPKTLNIVSGSVTVSKNGALQNMNVSKNSQKVKIGSYVLSAGSAEGVVISNIKVGLAPTEATSPSSYNVMDNIANLYISENTAPIQPQTSNDFNVNLALAANATKVIDVYVDLNELDAGDKLATNMKVTYRTEKTMNSGTTPVTPTPGQDMTVATGSLGAPTLVSTPNSFFVLGGSEATAANYKFVANNADAYINELSFATVTLGINQIIVNGVSAAVVDGEAKVSGLNIKIPAGLQGANVEVKAVYNNVTSAGQGGVETYANQRFYLDSYKYTVNGTQTTNDTVSEKSKDMKLVASYPLVANAQNYTDTTLKIGPKTEVMRFSVAATGNNPVNLDKVSFNLSSNHVALAAGADALKVVDATDLGTYLGTTSLATSSNMVVTFADDVTIEKGSVKTFVVYADTTGTLATGTAYFGLSLVNAGWAWNDGTTATSTDGTHIAEFTGTTFTISN